MDSTLQQNGPKAEALETLTSHADDGELPGIPDTTPSGENADKVSGIVEEVKDWGWWVFEKLQGAGEFIAGVLGLDESRFSYVINNMSEEDWKVARRVHAKREAQLAGRPYEEMEGGDLAQPIQPPEPPTTSEVASMESST